MNTFYQLACALVSWSALSLTAQAAALEALSSLPKEAFQLFPGLPECLVFLKPNIDLSAYQWVLIEPLALFGKTQDLWKLRIAAEHNPIERHYRAQLTRALRQHGVGVATEAGPGVMRLRSALALGAGPDDVARTLALPSRASIDLEALTSGVGRYLMHVSTIGQVEDSLNGALLAGSVELKDQQAPDSDQLVSLAGVNGRIDCLTEVNAARLARAINPQ